MMHLSAKRRLVELVGVAAIIAIGLHVSMVSVATQTAWESYKKMTMHPSVDQHLTDPALNGSIDLHAHCGPDSYARQWDGFEVAKLAKERGMRGVVLKNHWTETAGLAYLARKYGEQGIEVFGAVSLDTPTGGINPQTVRYMIDVVGHYGRIVWMPTHDSEHEVKYLKENRPFVSVSRDGKLLPEVLEVIQLIAQNDLTLATGHVSPDEAFLIMREAKKQGVQRIIVTHPMLGPQFTFLTVEQMQEAAKLGAYIEIVSGNVTGGTPEAKARVFDAIRKIGPDLVFVSTDSGLVGTPNAPDSMAMAAKALRAAGFSEQDLTKMFKDNPARLVKLPIN
jgi:hypothetical protein